MCNKGGLLRDTKVSVPESDDIVVVCSVVDPCRIDVQNPYSEEVRNCTWVHALRGD